MADTCYDIIIVGGGLAGLSQAIQASSAGYKTLLIEKEEYPFHKVCGEYISNESLPFLQRLGLNTNAMHLPNINQFMLTLPDGSSFETKLDLGGFGISRYTLDHLLYQQAIQCGAKIITGIKVQDVHFEQDQFTVYSGTNVFQAKVVSGSYGKRSNLDIKWKRNFTQQQSNWNKNYVAVKYHIQYDIRKDLIALHYFKQGYCGISAIEADKCCLCYLTTAQGLQAAGNNISAFEANVIYANPHLKRIFSQAVFLYDQPLTIAQVNFAPKTAVENHILLCGDAAGLITPLCGNGMSMALHSSKLAFEQIQEFLAGKISRLQMEKAYTKAWHELFSGRMITGRMIQRLSERNFNLKLLFYAMKYIPLVANEVIRRTHGKPF